ncbi:hypothetical protein CPB84DRAFT_384778 [Gymnopilus junonius]|uniref:Uncharacterized protein n=1 Tax=Gymnopilus junonius TaxID=109634 RepID=A0A9P5ND55_GYMJU|nr:hypothetical protein CPB84DRAFT_384778 [Gymnopilus junonius]
MLMTDHALFEVHALPTRLQVPYDQFTTILYSFHLYNQLQGRYAAKSAKTVSGNPMTNARCSSINYVHASQYCIQHSSLYCPTPRYQYTTLPNPLSHRLTPPTKQNVKVDHPPSPAFSPSHYLPSASLLLLVRQARKSSSRHISIHLSKGNVKKRKEGSPEVI